MEKKIKVLNNNSIWKKNSNRKKMEKRAKYLIITVFEKRTVIEKNGEKEQSI